MRLTKTLTSGMPSVVVLFGVISVVTTAWAQSHLIERKVGDNVVVGYQDTPLQPWTGNKYHVHDPQCPFPPIVKTTGDSFTPPPADAVVLFDGKSLAAWQPTKWRVVNGAVEVAGHESLTSRSAFGDCQLHVEWKTPVEDGGNFMNRGNSGVLLMGLYEIQVFDSWPGHQQQIYPDGQAASIYGQTPPLVNACKAPGQWQSYDIVFVTPRFQDGKLRMPGRVTVFHNGVLVQLNQTIHGPMAHRQILPYKAHPAKLPLVLQGHNCPVQYRNIWIRPIVVTEK